MPHLQSLARKLFRLQTGLLLLDGGSRGIGGGLWEALQEPYGIVKSIS